MHARRTCVIIFWILRKSGPVKTGLTGAVATAMNYAMQKTNPHHILCSQCSYTHANYLIPISISIHIHHTSCSVMYMCSWTWWIWIGTDIWIKLLILPTIVDKPGVYLHNDFIFVYIKIWHACMTKKSSVLMTYCILCACNFCGGTNLCSFAVFVCFPCVNLPLL